MSKPWLLVSPASRGIGLQLARHLLQTTEAPVVATARKNLDSTKDQILDRLDVDERRLKVLELDVTGASLLPRSPQQRTITHSAIQLNSLFYADENTIIRAASQCTQLFPTSTHHLRLAFCIPGILHPEKSPQQIEYDDALSTFKINALGPLMLSKHFSSFLPRKSVAMEPCDNLPSSAVLALMSARVGSISDNKLGGWYSYRASKAAVNSIAKSVDIYLRQRCGEKGMAVALHPGTVKTQLSEDFWGSTPKEKLFSVNFAAEKLVEAVQHVGLDGRGKCWDWEGKQIPP